MDFFNCGSHMKKKIAKVMYISSVFAVIIMGIVCLVLFITLSIFKTFADDDDDSFQYNFLTFNPTTKRKSNGFVTITEIFDSEYIYYVERNDHSLISKFGLKRYQCNGFCSCETSRKTAAIPLKRSLMVLVAAISSYVAIEKSRNDFQIECEKSLKDDCTSNFVKAEVDDCEEFDEDFKELEEYDDYEVDLEKKDYWCEGHCITADFKRKDHQEIAKIYSCETFKQKGVVAVEGDSEKAKLTFMRYYLSYYCKRESRESISTQLYDDKGELYDKRIKIKFCVGHLASVNPSVKCELKEEVD